ncbi:MAG: hypothetical protein WCJ62_10990 [Flavobacterium sp.]
MALPKATKKSNETVQVNSSDIDWIKTTLSSMSLKIQEVEVSLNRLNQTVIGDKVYGQVGLIEKVEEHNAYIEEDKHFKSKLIGGSFVLGTLWTVIVSFITNKLSS